jgi:hypothetical protein
VKFSGCLKSITAQGLELEHRPVSPSGNIWPFVTERGHSAFANSESARSGGYGGRMTPIGTFRAEICSIARILPVQEIGGFMLREKRQKVNITVRMKKIRDSA